MRSRLILLNLFIVLLSPVLSYSQIITTIAGMKFTRGYSGDGGPASTALLGYPRGICTDISDNLYIADLENHVIRKIDNAGIISTIAGNGTAGHSGDGGGSTAKPAAVPGGRSIGQHIYCGVVG